MNRRITAVGWIRENRLQVVFKTAHGPGVTDSHHDVFLRREPAPRRMAARTSSPAAAQAIVLPRTVHVHREHRTHRKLGCCTKPGQEISHGDKRFSGRRGSCA